MLIKCARRAARATTQALAALMLLLALDASGTTVWTWVDKNGVRHYSQVPAAGATRIEIGPSNRAAPYVAGSVSSPPDDLQRASAPTANAKYAEFAIAKPAEGETLINVGGIVPVNMRVDPALRPGHALVFYLDDNRVDGIASTATSFELKNVPRGTHLLVAVVQDERHGTLQEAAVTFNVRQTSIATPPGPLKPAQPLPKQNL